jgi:hypothetical protein
LFDWLRSGVSPGSDSDDTTVGLRLRDGGSGLGFGFGGLASRTVGDMSTRLLLLSQCLPPLAICLNHFWSVVTATMARSAHTGLICLAALPDDTPVGVLLRELMAMDAMRLDSVVGLAVVDVLNRRGWA